MHDQPNGRTHVSIQTNLLTSTINQNQPDSLPKEGKWRTRDSLNRRMNYSTDIYLGQKLTSNYIWLSKKFHFIVISFLIYLNDWLFDMIDSSGASGQTDKHKQTNKHLSSSYMSGVCFSVCVGLTDCSGQGTTTTQYPTPTDKITFSVLDQDYPKEQAQTLPGGPEHMILPYFSKKYMKFKGFTPQGVSRSCHLSKICHWFSRESIYVYWDSLIIIEKVFECDL